MRPLIAWMSPLALGACAPSLHVDVELDSDHPTVVHVGFDASEAGTSTVAFTLADGDGTEHTSPAMSGDGRHEHLLLGLKAGRPYDWEVTFEGSAGGSRRAHGTITAGDVPPDLPSFQTVTLDPDRAQTQGAYIMLAATNGDGGPKSADSLFFIGIIDHDADWVWWHLLPEGQGTVTGTPSLDGQSIFWTEYDERRTDPDGHIVRMTLDGEVLSETFANGAHHATVELPDGRFGWVGRVFAPMGGGRTAMTDTLVVNAEGATTAGTTLFDYVTDWFEGIDNFPYPPCRSVFPELYGRQNVCELTHTNSLVYVPDEDAFYMYPRTMDATLKLDGDGALQWQMGGPWSDFTLPDGSPVQTDFRENALWSQGHFSQIWPGGMMMFDNAMWSTPQVSALAEYAWDEQARTVQEVWRHPDPEGGYTSHLGDVRRLSGGNALASWMTLAKITEVTPEGDEVMHISSPDGTSPRRIFLLEDLYDLRKTGDRLP